MLTQNFVNKRLKIFGEAGINAFIDEVKKCTQEKCLSQKREMNLQQMREGIL